MYLLSSEESYLLLLLRFLHLMSSYISDYLDDEYDDNGSDSGSSGACYFHCVLTVPLVMLVAWGLAFLYQQELSPNVMFFYLFFLYQKESIPKVLDSSKCFDNQITGFPSKFKNHFYSYSHGLTFPHSF